MGDTATTLNEAYQLIENGQLADARNLLKPLLETDSSNPDVWWLYTHATEDPAEGRRSLEKLVELSPSYPGVGDLYEQVTGEPLKPAATAPKSLKPLARPEAPASLPDLPGSKRPVPAAVSSAEEDDFDDIVEDKPGRPLPWRIIAAVAVVVIVLIGVLLFLTSQQPAPVATETAVADVPTTMPTQEVIATQEIIATATEEAAATIEALPTETVVETSEPVATAEIQSATEEAIPTQEVVETAAVTEAVAAATTELIATNEPQATATEAPAATVEPAATQDAGAALLTALEPFGVTGEDAVKTTSTSLGNTLLVDACGIPGPDASRVLNGVMETLVSQSSNIPDDVEAVGVSITDCASSAPGRTVAVPMETARAYLRKEIDQREFQRLWKPVS